MFLQRPIFFSFLVIFRKLSANKLGSSLNACWLWVGHWMRASTKARMNPAVAKTSAVLEGRIVVGREALSKDWTWSQKSEKPQGQLKKTWKIWINVVIQAEQRHRNSDVLLRSWNSRTFFFNFMYIFFNVFISLALANTLLWDNIIKRGQSGRTFSIRLHSFSHTAYRDYFSFFHYFSMSLSISLLQFSFLFFSWSLISSFFFFTFYASLSQSAKIHISYHILSFIHNGRHTCFLLVVFFHTWLCIEIQTLVVSWILALWYTSKGDGIIYILYIYIYIYIYEF